MSFLPRHFPQPPFATALPYPLYFRTACMPADAAYPSHRHPWGEFVYSYSGVMEVRVGDRQYLVPSQYGLWLPPDVEHQGLNRYEACHSSLYVSGAACARLPAVPCALEVSPLVRALLEHLRQTPPQVPDRPEDTRLLEVLVDQLTLARPAGSYLPTSTDSLLAPVLAALEADPGDNRPVAALARQAGTTERTLTRRCLRDLGMPLSEWRQRLRVVSAMTRLERGRKVETIARELGYGSPSAFIAMFRRLTGVSPDEYRRRNGGG
ncbi:AraC family transcriptional regulator [Novispirillum itersonii]|uniref:AraC family transcriptional regulator n=1 Tax=Novispirillum itersonii TaxID=189 RepID=UPI0003773FAC|nr:helix-turn-helix transcriptional regulator [Novispirillum itersonii]